MAAPNSLILATADHLARFAPFDSMERERLIWLAERQPVARRSEKPAASCRRLPTNHGGRRDKAAFPPYGADARPKPHRPLSSHTVTPVDAVR